MDALPAAIPSIANKSAVATRPAAPPARTAWTTDSATTASSPESATAPAKPRSAPSARSCRSSWKNAGLSLHALSPKSAGSALQTQHGCPQSKVILTGLQTIAQRSIHQESLVGVRRTLGGQVGRWSSRKLIQFVFGVLRRCAEATLLLLGTLPELSRLSLLPLLGLQLQRPFGGLRRRPRPHLDLLASGLESKHLHFHRIGSGREIGELVGARFVGGSDYALVALGGGFGGSRQRLAAELDGSGVRDAVLRV